MTDRVITRLAAIPRPATFKEAAKSVQRVAAYARVSTDHEDQETSLSAQTEYYRKKITEHPGWEFVEIYVDDGISGLSTKHREGFNRMVEDCLAGRIDLILTKSISRFARNTVDTVTTIRKLKDTYCDMIRTVTHAKVNGKEKTTVVREAGKTKTSVRTVLLPTPVIQILKDATCKEGYVLGGEKPLCYSTFKRTYQAAFEKLGIKGKCSNYDFRTTFGTELCEAGLSSKQVGDMMGHADTRMVETVYARTRHEGIMKHRNMLDQLNQAYAT